jgi:hypothetical protein
MEERMFKIGDIVTCIDKPTDCPINTFNGDNKFTVMDIDKNKAGKQTILIRNTALVIVGWWLGSRFAITK